jgi:hypothetical protein
MHHQGGFAAEAFFLHHCWYSARLQGVPTRFPSLSGEAPCGSADYGKDQTSLA